MRYLGTYDMPSTAYFTMQAARDSMIGRIAIIQYPAAEVMRTIATLDNSIDIMVGHREYERLPVVTDKSEMETLYDLVASKKSVIQRTLVLNIDGVMLFDYKIMKVPGGFHIAGAPTWLALVEDHRMPSNRARLWESTARYATQQFFDESVSSIAASHKIICSAPNSLELVLDSARRKDD